MVVISWSGAVCHNHVDIGKLMDGKLGILCREYIRVICAHLKEPLWSGRTMLGAHTLHSVRKKHHQAGLSHPLGLPTGNELVNDALGSVCEVSKLSLPQHQSIGVGHGVAQLKSKDAVFGQRAIAHRVGSLVWIQVFYGVVGGHVLCLVVQHVVAVGEGASFDILAGESDMDSIFKKRTKSKSLSHCPINLSCLNHLSPGLVDSLHSGMDYEIWGIWGSLGKSRSNVLKSLLRAPSIGHFQWILAFKESRPGRVKPVFVVDLSFLRSFLIGLFTNFVIFFNNCLNFFVGCYSFSNQLLAVDVQNIRVFLNNGVHDWLGKHGLINLIVAKLSVAHQVYDDISVPG